MNSNDEAKLKRYRQLIDEIDSSIFWRLANRFEHAELIAEIKKRNGLPTNDPNRERAVLRHLEKSGLAYSDEIKNVYLAIFNEMKKVEDR